MTTTKSKTQPTNAQPTNEWTPIKLEPTDEVETFTDCDGDGANGTRYDVQYTS
jgi:hypothetical protein